MGQQSCLMINEYFYRYVVFDRYAILHAKLQLFFELCKKKEAYYILLLRNNIL